MASPHPTYRGVFGVKGDGLDRTSEPQVYAGSGLPSDGVIDGRQSLGSSQAGVRFRSDWDIPGEAVSVTRDGGSTWYAIGGPSFGRREIFDDFMRQAIDETNGPWLLNSGADAQAIDPAISGGVLVLTSGDADGTMANDGSQIVCAVPVQAGDGGLIVEARLHINTAITDVSVNFGLTDVTSLEEPFAIGGGDAITSNASDAACFVYDSGADTDEWFAVAVDSDSDDAASATTGTAPAADTYQLLRIEVNGDGSIITYSINGSVVKTLSGGTGVSPDVNLYATVTVCSTTTTQKTVDVDYIYVGTDR